MCGIVGFYNRRDNACHIDSNLLCRMRDTMAYRGPDDYGIYIDPDRGWGVAHRRLSIIGVATGQQPMWDGQHQVCIVYNGEIYNYRELRGELEKLRHRFRTDSDTEVIIEAYREWGMDALSRFDGMFAFALYDSGFKKLILARDRIGIKPLFYYWDGDTIIYGSEIKAILPALRTERRVSQQGLYEVMRFGACVGSNTIFDGIYRLEPGCYMEISERGVKTCRYWDVVDSIRSNRVPGKDEDEKLDAIDEVFRTAVRRRMISEVPLGAYLSGGIDSSLVVALMSIQSDRPINSFSVTFDDPNYNEEQYSDAVAAKYGTNHHKLHVTEDEIYSAIVPWIEHMDDLVPQRDGLPRFLIARLVREQGITVVLSGSGADELFAGYWSHIRWQKQRRLSESIWPAARPLLKLSSMAMDSIPYLFYRNQADRYHDRAARLDILSRRKPGYNGETDYFKLGSMNKLVVYRGRESISDIYDRFDGKPCDAVNESLLIDIINRLPNDALMREDRLNMAHSLESRVPILSHHMVELAMGIKGDNKIRNGETKYIWKRYAERYLPSNLIYRRKVGFGYPMERWLKTRLRNKVIEFFYKDKVVPFFRYSGIQKHWEAHDRGLICRPGEIWALLAFELWYRRWILNEPIDINHSKTSRRIEKQDSRRVFRGTAAES
jgi:asparagine synthase (glutamine-hydrolysing)